VVHLATAEETMALLRGDGSVEAEQVVEVPLYDEDAAFTGDFVVSVDRAQEVLEAFISTGIAEKHGTWFPL
jgi:hypothetical protein